MCAAVSGLSQEAALVEDIPFCSKPVKSTGAGDRFNAGYCIGLLLGCNLRNCILCGVACSGVFVRQGTSASLEQMAAFLLEQQGLTK